MSCQRGMLPGDHREVADRFRRAWLGMASPERDRAGWRLGADAWAVLWHLLHPAGQQAPPAPPPGSPLLRGARLRGLPLRVDPDVDGWTVELLPELPAPLHELPAGLQRQVLDEGRRLADRLACAWSAALAALAAAITATSARVFVQPLTNPFDPDPPPASPATVVTVTGPLLAARRWLRTPPERRWDCADHGHLAQMQAAGCQVCGQPTEAMEVRTLGLIADGQHDERWLSTQDGGWEQMATSHNAAAAAATAEDFANHARRLAGEPYRWGAAGPDEPPTVFTCPVCGAASRSVDDARHGYCGRCHTFTGEPQPDFDQPRQLQYETVVRRYAADLAAQSGRPLAECAALLRRVLTPTDPADAVLPQATVDAAGELPPTLGAGQDAAAIQARLAAVDATLAEAQEWESSWEAAGAQTVSFGPNPAVDCDPATGQPREAP